LGLPIVAAQARADDLIGYSHERYAENHDRMTVRTESVRAAVTINPWLDLTLRGVYHPIMQPDRNPMQAAEIDHVYFSREAASGDRTVGGDGCGCN